MTDPLLGPSDPIELCPDCGAPLLWFKRPGKGWWECSNECGFKTPPSIHLRDREAEHAD